MLNHLNPSKTITIIGFVAAIGGLINVLLPLIAVEDYREGYPAWRIITSATFQTVYLNYFEPDVLLFWVGNETYRAAINVADLVFYFLFLGGVIAFVANGFRSVQLIGFCFAVVFFVQCVELPLGIYNVINRYELLRQQDQFGWTFLFFASNILWLVLSLYVLKAIARHRALLVEEYEEDGVRNASFYTSDKTKRFIHLVVDRIMIILISSTWVFVFRDSLESIANDPSDSRVFLTLLYIIAMFVYYPFFEGILGATPAKYLTSTKVADAYGNKPGMGTIFVRTLCRLIPFDAISFFGSRGWHDSLSNTYVLDEGAAGSDESTFSFEEKKSQG